MQNLPICPRRSNCGKSRNRGTSLGRSVGRRDFNATTPQCTCRPNCRPAQSLQGHATVFPRPNLTGSSMTTTPQSRTPCDRRRSRCCPSIVCLPVDPWTGTIETLPLRHVPGGRRVCRGDDDDDKTMRPPANVWSGSTATLAHHHMLGARHIGYDDRPAAMLLNNRWPTGEPARS